MSGLNKKLKELRIEKKLTQKELAQMLSITIPTLSHWECAYQEPSYDDLISICNFFNVSTDYLLGRTDELGSVVMPSPTAPTLADDERKLLDYYGQMSHPMKIRVIAYCEGMLSTGQNAASKRNA